MMLVLDGRPPCPRPGTERARRAARRRGDRRRALGRCRTMRRSPAAPEGDAGCRARFDRPVARRARDVGLDDVVLVGRQRRNSRSPRLRTTAGLQAVDPLADPDASCARASRSCSRFAAGSALLVERMLDAESRDVTLDVSAALPAVGSLDRSLLFARRPPHPHRLRPSVVPRGRVGRPARWRDVIRTITAFTVAHSLTLLLAATGLLVVPGRHRRTIDCRVDCLRRRRKPDPPGAGLPLEADVRLRAGSWSGLRHGASRLGRHGRWIGRAPGGVLQRRRRSRTNRRCGVARAALLGSEHVAGFAGSIRHRLVGVGGGGRKLLALRESRVTLLAA